MAYKILSTEIENDVLVSRVALIMDDKSIVEVCVPVKFPKTEQAVLDAIAYREALEKAKYNAAPTLTVIKAALDARIEKAG